jgi:hypothetical protein
MFMREANKLNLGSVINWVATSEKLPIDVENYLVYGDGMYTVTFYSRRRKRWNTDFDIEYYAELPKPPCL